MPRKTAPDASPVADFEASLDALEQLVEQMERGEMGLEESLAAYERGVGLYRRCQSALEQAELRVKLLSDPADPATQRFAAGRRTSRTPPMRLTEVDQPTEDRAVDARTGTPVEPDHDDGVVGGLTAPELGLGAAAAAAVVAGVVAVRRRRTPHP